MKPFVVISGLALFALAMVTGCTQSGQLDPAKAAAIQNALETATAAATAASALLDKPEQQAALAKAQAALAAAKGTVSAATAPAASTGSK